MKLPFDSNDFFNVFGSYNEAIWPLQILAYLLSLSWLFLFFKKHKHTARAAFYLLSFLWLVNGVGYHLLHFSAINKAAYVFGGLFVAQALLFAWKARKMPSSLSAISPARKTAALILIAYAIFFYSLLGYFSGHQYPKVPICGVAPCPTTIFTFGVLLLAADRLKWYVYLIPLLWALVGTSAAFSLGVREDFGLAAAAIIFVGFQFLPPFFITSDARNS